MPNIIAMRVSVRVVTSVLLAIILSSLVKTEESKTENGEIVDMFAELESIKQNIKRLDSSLNSINSRIQQRVNGFTKQVEYIQINITEQWKNFEKKTSPVSVPFLPREPNNEVSKRREIICNNNLFALLYRHTWLSVCSKKNIHSLFSRDYSLKFPVCPARSCFDRMTVRTDIADSIKLLDTIPSNRSIGDCVYNCLTNIKCAGIRLSPNKCALLSRHHPHIELNYTISYKRKIGMTKLLLRKRTDLGQCSYRFRKLRWKQSGYQLFWTFASWKEAHKKCLKYGSKLAELTTWDEISNLARYQEIKRVSSRFFHVRGMQTEGSPEPDKGWHWIPSNITIPSHGFVWKLRKPDNAGGRENVLGAQFYRGRIRFMDNREEKQAIPLCECLRFGSIERTYRLDRLDFG